MLGYVPSMCVAWCHRCVWAAKCGYVTTLGAHALTPAPPRGVKDPFLDVRPEVLEPMRRQLGVAHRVLDVLVTEVRLQRLGVVASIGQGISTNGQDLSAQDAELMAAGCAKVFKEKVSGARRPIDRSLPRQSAGSSWTTCWWSRASIGLRARRAICSMPAQNFCGMLRCGSI